jgi:hypothetical protein
MQIAGTPPQRSERLLLDHAHGWNGSRPSPGLDKTNGCTGFFTRH